MKIAVLASSSTGNSTYVEVGNVKFLIDAGMSYSYIKDKLIMLDVFIHLQEYSIQKFILEKIHIKNILKKNI